MKYYYVSTDDVCLFVYLFVCLFICLFVYLFVCLFEFKIWDIMVIFVIICYWIVVVLIIITFVDVVIIVTITVIVVIIVIVVANFEVKNEMEKWFIFEFLLWIFHVSFCQCFHRRHLWMDTSARVYSSLSSDISLT